MISSSSILGGGTKHMFMLGKSLSDDFKVYYAIPMNKNFSRHLNSKNHLKISERRLVLSDLIRLKNFIKVNSIDIIHSHGKGAGALARIAKIFVNKPLIHTFHGIHLKCHHWYKNIFYIFYENLFGILDTSKVFVSKSEKKYAEASKIYLGNNSLIINNGVKNMPLKGSEYTQNFNCKAFNISKIKVISVCRFVHQKNIQDIIKIAIKL